MEPSAGPDENVTSGAVVSTVHVRETRSVFWARSVALTWNVCEPSARPEAVYGELQLWKPPPSSWQLRPAPESLEVKPNEGLGLAETMPWPGPEEILTTGATVSTVKERQTTGLSFPGASIALTKKT